MWLPNKEKQYKFNKQIERIQKNGNIYTYSLIVVIYRSAETDKYTDRLTDWRTDWHDHNVYIFTVRYAMPNRGE